MERVIIVKVKEDILDMFEKVSKMHNRTRSGELRSIMIEAIKEEFPEWKPGSDE